MHEAVLSNHKEPEDSLMEAGVSLAEILLLAVVAYHHCSMFSKECQVILVLYSNCNISRVLKEKFDNYVNIP